MRFWRVKKTRPSQLHCPPIRKQSFQNSGFSDVADPRYAFPQFPRLAYDLRRFGTPGLNGLRNPRVLVWLRPDLTIDSFWRAKRMSGASCKSQIGQKPASNGDRRVKASGQAGLRRHQSCACVLSNSVQNNQAAARALESKTSYPLVGGRLIPAFSGFS